MKGVGGYMGEEIDKVRVKGDLGGRGYGVWYMWGRGGVV